MDVEPGIFAYWPFIEKCMPDYYRSDDVLHSDFLARYLEGEEVLEDDLPWIMELGTRQNVVDELIEIDSQLFREALTAYLHERYAEENRGLF